MTVTREHLDQYDSSAAFLSYQAATERDPAKRRKLLSEYAQCVAEKTRARIRFFSGAEIPR